jgi:hypothetical protein
MGTFKRFTEEIDNKYTNLVILFIRKKENQIKETIENKTEYKQH